MPIAKLDGLGSRILAGWRAMPRRPWLLAMLVAGAALATFHATASFEFLDWDDNIVLVHNEHLRQLDLASLRWMLTDASHGMRWVPLGWLSTALLIHLFGLVPGPIHILALLFHAASAVLLFFILLRLFSSELAASLGALVWAVHPMRVEVVAWATQARYAQAGFFAFACLLVYLKDHRRFYWGSVALFFASVASYPLAIGLVPALLVLDWFVLHRTDWRRLLLEKIPFAVPAALGGALTLAARLSTTTHQQAPTLAEFPLFARVAQACYLLAWYTWRPLVPAWLSLVNIELVDFDPHAVQFLASGALCLLITIVAVAWRKRTPALLGVWLLHVVLLLPMLGLTEHPHYAADRYSYLQAAILAAVLTWMAARSRPFALALLLLLPALCFISQRRAESFRDSHTFFSAAIEEMGNDPYRADFYARLAAFEARDGHKELALSFYRTAWQIDPRMARAAANSGWLALELHLPAEAIEGFEAALRVVDAAELRSGLAQARAMLPTQ